MGIVNWRKVWSTKKLSNHTGPFPWLKVCSNFFFFFFEYYDSAISQDAIFVMLILKTDLGIDCFPYNDCFPFKDPCSTSNPNLSFEWANKNM